MWKATVNNKNSLYCKKKVLDFFLYLLLDQTWEKDIEILSVQTDILNNYSFQSDIQI